MNTLLQTSGIWRVGIGLLLVLMSLTAHAKPSAVSASNDQGLIGPSQASLSLDTSWNLMPSDDPTVTKSLNATDLGAAQKLFGYNGSFHGTVAKVVITSNNRSVILTFSADNRKTVTAVLQSRYFTRFPDMRGLAGQHLMITGRWVSHDGKPEIVLTKLSQITLVIDPHLLGSTSAATASAISH